MSRWPKRWSSARRWRLEQRRNAWFPRFGKGVEGFTARLSFIALAGGPDSTNLGSSLRPLARLGAGAESAALVQHRDRYRERVQ